MEQQDVERIARAALRDLGVSASQMTIAAVDGQPGHFRIDIAGSRGASRLKIRCGQGSTPQWVRDQILEQYQAQS